MKDFPVYRGIPAAIHSSLEDFNKFGTIMSRIALRMKHYCLYSIKDNFFFINSCESLHFTKK